MEGLSDRLFVAECLGDFMDTETMEGGFDENEFSDLDHDVNEVSKRHSRSVCDH